MRAYVPASWRQVAQLLADGSIPGPLRGCAVDPRWRAGAPDVDEEEWEYEAQVLAAGALTATGAPVGMLLAVDLPGELPVLDDGWGDWTGPIERGQVAAVLDSELAWFGLQELPGVLADRSTDAADPRL